MAIGDLWEGVRTDGEHGQIRKKLIWRIVIWGWVICWRMMVWIGIERYVTEFVSTMRSRIYQSIILALYVEVCWRNSSSINMEVPNSGKSIQDLHSVYFGWIGSSPIFWFPHHSPDWLSSHTMNIMISCLNITFKLNSFIAFCGKNHLWVCPWVWEL